MFKQIIQNSVKFIPGALREKIRKIPLISDLQRKILELFLHNKPFVHTIDYGPAKNLKLEIILPKDKPIWLGNYEFEFANAIANNVSNDVVCLDVGSYIGYMAAVMALNGASDVYCFEPLPENIKAINKLCNLNPDLPIRVVNTAIGDHIGQAKFSRMPDASMGKLSDSKFQKERENKDIITVPITTIDSFLERESIKKKLLIKIDVEGAELSVLTGAINTLLYKKPVLFIEAHGEYLEKECRSLLEYYQYKIIVLEKERLLVEETRHLVASV